MIVEVCFEDDYLVAVSKPNNLLVHHSFMARNVGEESTLVELAQKQMGMSLFPIHRLDRKTSGLLLFAKQKEQVSKFQTLFQLNKIQKTYHAVVRGFSPSEGVIESPVKGRDANVYKDALTAYRKLGEVSLDVPVKPYSTSRYSLLELTPKTGRLHQLRIHMNKIAHPIIGDPKYGDRFHNRMFQEEMGFSKMFLHASSIKFVHPFTQEDIKIKAKFPSDWLSVFEKFNWTLTD